jgi:hypothetical protein
MTFPVMAPHNFKRNNLLFGKTYCFSMAEVRVHVTGTSVKSAISYGTTECRNAGDRDFSFGLSALRLVKSIDLKQFV